MKEKNIKIIGIGSGACDVMAKYQKICNYDNIKIIVSDTASCPMRQEGIKYKLPLVHVLSIYRTVKSIFEDENANLDSIMCCVGCEGNTKLGELAAIHSSDRILQELKGTDKLILFSCFGKGTGTGATKVFLDIAKKMNIDTTCIIQNPLINFSPQKRFDIAKEGLKYIKENCNNVVVLDVEVIKGINLIENWQRIEEYVLSKVNEEVEKAIGD